MLVRDILLEPIKGNILSEGIAETIKSKYSHSAIQTKLGHVIEANFDKGVICTDSYEWHRNNANRKIIMSDWYESNIDPYTLVGRKYFKGKFINFLLFRVFTWLRLNKLANNIINRANEDQLVCSTINAKCRGIANDWLVLPKDLETYLVH
jgi:hypothetical protein